MLILIAIILLIFIIAFTGIWIWFFRNENGNYQGFYSLGIKAYKDKEYDKAKDFLTKALEIKPNFKEGLYRLGLVHLELKEYEEAKICFEKALKIAPKDFNALFSFALTLQMQDAYEEAIEQYNKAIKENGKNSDCYFNLGVITFKQGDFQKSLELLEKALEINPNDSKIYFYITKCKDELCDYHTDEEGQLIIEEYLKIADSKDLPVEFNITLSTAYAKCGQLDLALKACQKAMLAQSENIECYKMMGLIQLLKKDLIGAKSTLATGLHLQADSDEIHEILSYTLCQQEDRCALQKCREKYMELVQKFVKPK